MAADSINAVWLQHKSELRRFLLSRKKGPGANFYQQLLRLTRGDCLRLSRSAARSDFKALPGGFCDAVEKA
jgi:hypothetical protein